ncbi:hypothetical protein C0J52_16263 [Blattella germanica]|nr:hypothetical protein C0J52_16263 [Blattella germanica]
MSIPQDMEPQRVDRRPGTANMEGELYEVGMATLLFLRGYFQTSDFSLNVNVDGVGAFDDVNFEYRQQSGARCKAYMQLKHKASTKPKDITREALCAKTGDFSLIRYFDSFCEIRQRYGITDADQFVIYTNAGLPELPGVQILDHDSLLSTGEKGKIYKLAGTEEEKTAFKLLEPYKAALNDIKEQYTEKEIKQKLTPFAEMSHCKRLLKTLEMKVHSTERRMNNFNALLQKQLNDELTAQVWQCFIDKLRLFVRQVSVKDLDNLIKETLRHYLGTDRLFLQLKHEMTEWWREGNFTLSNNSPPFWVSAVQDLVSDLAAPVIKRLSPISEIVFTEKLELSAKVVQIFTEGCTEISCLQVQQSLKDVGHFIVDFNTLASRTDEVLLKWRFLDWCRVLVVEGPLDHSGMSIEKINNIMSKVCDILQSTEKRIISISNNCADSFIANLSKHFKVEVHHENFNLSLLDEKSIARILDCEVDFQGIPVKLGTLADNPKTREAVKGNLLLALLSKGGPIKIGECLPKPGPNYVARTFYRKECVRNNIFQNNVFPKLAVSGLSKEQLCQIIGDGDKIEQFNENTNFVDNSSRYFIIKGAQDFNYLCKKYNEDIHWIHRSEERFVWMHSNGPLKPIIEHLEDVEVKYDKIESFVNLPHKVVLILGEPGMGKSEELKCLASQLKLLDESTWVVRVVLNDCAEDLSKEQFDVRELLLKAANISEFGKELFDYQLETGGNIIVLLDGLDEINPNYTEKVNSMIECLTKKVRKIWLTSRPIMWGVLEEQFRVLPFLLSPLTKNEQMNLLPKLWTYTESCGKDRTDFEHHATMFAEKLLKMTDTTLKDSLIFLSVPLHLMLLAEVLKNEVVKSCKNDERDIPRRLDLLNLYSDFVDIKWDLYCEKIKLDTKVPGMAKIYASGKRLTQDEVMNSAMVTLFDEDINQLSNAKEILDVNSEFLGKLDSGEEMVGLVTHVQNGKAAFVHRTFAEYFAALWFSKNYLSNLDYFRKFYLSGSFETVRMFFDRILARENKLHTCVLSCNIDEITTLLSENNAVIDEMDSSGRTALHLAVANFLNLLFNRKNTTINNIVYHNFDDNELLPIPVRQDSNKNVTYLLQIVEVLLKDGADCSISDNILSCTPLQFAENNRIWCLLDLLLEYYSVEPGDLSVIKDNIQDQNFVRNVLEAAAVDECVNVIQLMFDYGACDSTFYFSHKRTLLHVAAFLGHLKLTHFLIDRGVDLEARDVFRLTPLMASCLNHNHKVTKMLLEQGADPNATFRRGRSAIHYVYGEPFSRFTPNIDDEYKTQAHGLRLSTTDGILILLEHGANPYVGYEFGYGKSRDYKFRYINGVIKGILAKPHNISVANINLIAKSYKKKKSEFDLKHRASDFDTPDELQQILDKYEEQSALKEDIKCKNPENAKTFIKSGQHPNIKDEYGNSVAHFAVNFNLVSTVDLLLNLECDFDGFNREGETPLLTAIKLGNEEIARKLLKHGANPNAKDKYGNSPMHYAAEYNLMKVVECLLELDCDIDCTNTNGETPLINVIKEGNEEIAIKLLKHIPNPNAKDEYGRTPMHYAAEKNLMKVVECLLELKCDIDCTSKYGETPLLKAIKWGNEEITIKLLKHGANPNAKDEYGRTPMHYAAEKNLMKVVEYLLELKCDIDCTNKKGETPLINAIKMEYEEMAIKLLKLGANPKAKDEYGRTPMHYAVKKNLMKVVECRLELKCDIDCTNKYGDTPLLEAIEQGNEEMAIKLLKLGANLNAKDEYGRTPMHYAAGKNLMKVVECLLELKCDIDCTSKYGQTPLLHAIKWRNEEIAITLLKLGANPNAKDKYGRTPMHYAVEANLIKVVECLLELKCYIDCTSKYGYTPLLIAITRLNDEIGIKLLKHGANPNAKDECGRTPMHHAVEANLIKVVECLLELECDIDCSNTEGGTPLLKAIEQGNEEIAITLLNHGANPNANKYGNTAMHYAAKKRLIKVVECLLELKCDLSFSNNQGYTPLMELVKEGNEEIAINLLKHGANPNAKDKYGNTLMHYAAENYLLKVVECLLELKSDINFSNNRGDTPLMEVAKEGNEEIAIKLLKHGSNANAKDRHGNTPMHYAAGKNLMKVMECLLELECDIDCSNTEGETPLLKATKQGNEEISMKLLKLGANPNTKDKYDNTVMHFAGEKNLANTVDLLLNLECPFDSLNKNGVTPLLKAIKRRNEEIAIKLLKHGANPNAKYAYGDTLMHYAAEKNLMKVLGANPNTKDKYGNTVMHFAAETNLANTVDLLLKLECPFDCLNKEGVTPLLKVIKRRNEEIAIKLLKHGANPKAKDANYNTPMHYAAEKNLMQVVECLLELECDIDCSNTEGETPLLKATKQGNEEISMKLIKLGANPNTKDKYGNTVMHFAAEENLVNTVDLLLNLECPFDSLNKEGVTPLLKAIKRRNEEIAIKLLKHGANPNATFKWFAS